MFNGSPGPAQSPCGHFMSGCASQTHPSSLQCAQVDGAIAFRSSSAHCTASAFVSNRRPIISSRSIRICASTPHSPDIGVRSQTAGCPCEVTTPARPVPVCALAGACGSVCRTVRQPRETTFQTRMGSCDPTVRSRYARASFVRVRVASHMRDDYLFRVTKEASGATSVQMTRGRKVVATAIGASEIHAFELLIQSLRDTKQSPEAIEAAQSALVRHQQA
jgi:hypothetical protein